MSLLSLSHVTKHYEGPTILDDVTAEVPKGRKIGIIGRNGCGKSTLLRIMVGEIEPSSGDVFRQRGVRVAYQAQELSCPPGATVTSEMHRVFADHLQREQRLRDLEEKLGGTLAAMEQERLLATYSRLQDEHHGSGGYEVEQRIASVLSGLGLPEALWGHRIAEFSGGERNIIGLARILLSDPDILLLDEPSNHLDLDGIEWFIRFVRQTPSTVVMVSHNRHVLDATVEEVWEVRRGALTRYSGNYTDFQQQHAEALALQERQYRNQRRQIERLQFQARRLRDMARAYDDPGQARRAKAMLKRIEHMDKVEKPSDHQKVFSATIDDSQRHGRLALNIEDFSFSYGDRKIFDRATLEINYGDRVCLLGPNGSGKTTLFREVLEHGSWENPTLRLGKSVRIGDYNQFHEEALDGSATLVDWLQDRTGLLYQAASDLLHRFLFSRDDLDRPISTLSGGEKSRVQLARLVHDRVNFLLLDEPTNHLDIPSCESLEQTLEEFEGTLLIISHDRYFLEKIVDVVVEIEDHRLQPYRGSFLEWWQSHMARVEARSGGALQLHSQKRAVTRTKDAAVRDREERKVRQRDARRLRTRLARIEDRIGELEDRERELSAALEAAYSLGGDPERGPPLARELDQTREQLATANLEWEDLAAQVARDEADPAP